MAAITRWVKYEIDAVGSAGDGDGEGCKGTRGYCIGTASVGDSFTIGSTTNRLHLSIDGEAASYITLYSGSSLDPRFVARDITEKLHLLSGQEEEYWSHAICKWENIPDKGNKFKIYSGSLGSGSSVTVTSGTNDARTVLGFSTKSEIGGSATGNTYPGTASVSGTYYGFFDEIYKVVIACDNGGYVRGIDTPSHTGGTYAGTLTTGGMYNGIQDTVYTISIDATNGTTMGAGTSNVPTMSWTDTGNDTESSVDTELLYPDYWYKVGTRGLMVKFTDAVFSSSDAWTIDCYQPDYAEGSNASAAVGVAKYTWSSDRGDDSSSPITTSSGVSTILGSRGLYIEFINGGGSNLYAGDEFYVICAAPLPCDKGDESSHYNITSLNYGNVTVSTESDVKSVMFEVESGAAQMSTVKFGLQSHGTFSHHDTGNADTYFRFGTVGPGAPKSGTEWYPNIVAADIDSDVPPSYLYTTKEDLAVVATADLSEAIGNYPICGLTGDPIWLNIRLGASETGANSNINYRLYFDYS